jgi:hypothetical protein
VALFSALAAVAMVAMVQNAEWGIGAVLEEKHANPGKEGVVKELETAPKHVETRVAKMPPATPASCPCMPPQACFCQHINFKKFKKRDERIQTKERLTQRKEGTEAATLKLEHDTAVLAKARAEKKLENMAKFKKKLIRKLKIPHDASDYQIKKLGKLEKLAVDEPTEAHIEAVAKYADSLKTLRQAPMPARVSYKAKKMRDAASMASERASKDRVRAKTKAHGSKIAARQQKSAQAHAAEHGKQGAQLTKAALAAKAAADKTAVKKTTQTEKVDRETKAAKMTEKAGPTAHTSKTGVTQAVATDKARANTAHWKAKVYRVEEKTQVAGFHKAASQAKKQNAQATRDGKAADKDQETSKVDAVDSQKASSAAVTEAHKAKALTEKANKLQAEQARKEAAAIRKAEAYDKAEKAAAAAKKKRTHDNGDDLRHHDGEADHDGEGSEVE